MSKTPSKKAEYLNNFIPKEISSPIKDSPGISNTVYTHILSLHKLLSDWANVQEKGTKICKSLSALKLYECDNNYYPHQTKPLIESLLEALDALENVVEGVDLICSQIKAIAKLQPSSDPVINTWSVSEIAKNILQVTEALQKEFHLKQIITENIAHCRDENLIEVYVTAWEFESYFSMDSSAYLFAEVGLAGVS